MSATHPEPIKRTRRRSLADQAEFRQTILKLANAIFAAEGYDALSMRRLANEAGVPPMTLYRYFPSKYHLLRHIWDDLLVEAAASANAASANATEPTAVLTAWLGGFVDYWLNNRDHYLLVFTTGHEGSRESLGLAPYLEASPGKIVLEHLGSLLDACLPAAGSAGSLGRDARRALGEWLMCRLFGLLHPVLYLPTFPWRSPALLRDEMLAEVAAKISAVTGRCPPAAT